MSDRAACTRWLAAADAAGRPCGCRSALLREPIMHAIVEVTWDGRDWTSLGAGHECGGAAEDCQGCVGRNASGVQEERSEGGRVCGCVWGAHS
jgi:hypothetical protein